MLEERVLARCPSCRNTFSTERPGRQVCPVCGKPLVVPDVAQGVLPPVPQSPPPEEPSGPLGTPWERRGELGFASAWARTVTQALFEPSRFFASARVDRNAAQVGFAVLTASAFAVVGQFVEHLFLAAQREQIGRMLGNTAELPPALARYLDLSQRSGPGVFVGIAIFTPLVMLAFLYVSAVVTHGVGLVLGQSKRGFPATLAACAYGFAPLVLLALPGCGVFIAVVWVAVLTGIGLKELHGIGSGGAVATVIVPYVVLCCATCGLGVLVATSLSKAMPR
ncbi:MAG: YIP1 family protein [Myxococcales bacterium]